jgi:membrane fusion protein (multidrug efflux system)
MVTAVQTRPEGAKVRSRLFRISGTVLLTIFLAAGLILILLVLAGAFTPKVPTQSPAPLATTPTNLPSAEVRLLRRSRHEAVVGTIRAVHEAAVASKLLARVTEVRVRAGQSVAAGEVLVSLDDADLQARYKQTEAAAAAAKVAKEQAERDYKRAQELLPSGGISKEEFDHRKMARRATTAELERAEHRLREAQVLLDYATIRSPITGIVVDKRVEAGDTARPGQVLLTLYNPKRMQMVVTVPESLALRLKVGQKVAGRLEALGEECQATVSEIVPEAQVASRSFAVKVTGPCPPGVYTGMFGRIFIPLEDEEVVVVPAAAVVHVGQLDMVRVVEEDRLQRRIIQTGRRLDDDVEILAGLKPGEKVVVQPREKGVRP